MLLRKSRFAVIKKLCLGLFMANLSKRIILFLLLLFPVVAQAQFKPPAHFPKPKPVTTLDFTGIKTKDLTKSKRSNQYVGIALNGLNTGIVYKNSSGEKLNYTKRLSTGWEAGYLYKSGSLMAEASLGYLKTETNFISSGITTNLVMDYVRTSLLGSYIFLNGQVRLKIGAGIGTGHLTGGIQKNNGYETDLVANKVFKRMEWAGIAEGGLLFEPNNKTLFQFVYVVRRGLSNIENTSGQTTKTIGNGLQASVYFDF